MSDQDYQTSGELESARRRYYLQSILNGISFRLLAGNIITLYVLRLGAGNAYVGALSSFLHISMVFLLVGRPLVSKHGAVKIQSTFWMFRYILMVPVLISLLPALRTNTTLVFVLVALGVFGFHTSKGIALAGQKATLGSIVSDKDRGEVLSRIQSLNTTVSTLAWLVVGVALTRNPSFLVYGVTFGAGILFGVGASAVLSTLPEPRGIDPSTRRPLLQSVRAGLAGPEFRRLSGTLFLKNLLLGMTGAFLVVQFKRVFLHTDGSLVYITLIGSLGIITMAALAGLLMDRLGAKPLFFAFSVIAAASLLPIVFGPAATSGVLVWIIPCVAMFFFQMGANGMANCSQDYFFAVVAPEERLNLGVFYNITAGIAGFIGSLGGGVLLDFLLVRLPVGETAVFRLYFGGLLVALAALSLLVMRLPDIGAYSIRNTLSILFSPRDLRAIRNLKRLGRSSGPEEEMSAIRALAKSPSAVSTEDLVQRLASPSFAVRTEALGALRGHPLDGRAQEALIAEIEDHEFTTAHIAAEIIGEQGIVRAVLALTKALESEDFMLCGKAMVALGRLRHRPAVPRMVAILAGTVNPRLIIHGARAFVAYDDPELIEHLLAKLEPRIAPFVRDELILAIAELAGLGDRFYALYAVFLERQLAGAAELRAELTDGPTEVARLARLVPGKSEVFRAAASQLLRETPIRVRGLDLTEHLLVCLGSETILSLARFRFLLAALLVWQSNEPQGTSAVR